MDVEVLALTRRSTPEEECSLRTPFQRDADRIVHAKAFRRLKYKTQVFPSPAGDHIRTRLTHTLEVTRIARTVARALGLDEDLTEAIGLGHDLGHPPFGHIGEEMLDACLAERFDLGFRHYEHSLRVVEVIEPLNLTEAVRDGIAHHSGRAEPPATLEGAIVRVVDRIAYINHDIDDALRAGVIGESDLPAAEIAILGATGSGRIDTLVHDLVDHSAGRGQIVQGEQVGEAMTRLRAFMFERVYLGAEARREHAKIHAVIKTLFAHYCDYPKELPPGDGPVAERVTDYLAGMTDRFATAAFERLVVPQPFGAGA